MDCRTAESLIDSYIKKNLTVEELEQFLEHVKLCPSCYDELETYFTVYFATLQLDGEKEDESFDINRMLKEDIRRRERRVRGFKFRRFLFCVFMLIVLGFLAYEILTIL